jgi:cell division protein FtsB
MRPGIRWDRLVRVFLIGVLVAILCMYASPVSRWITQSRTADADKAELQQLEKRNAGLKARLAELRKPQALELRARELGMVQRGERAFVITGKLPGN